MANIGTRVLTLLLFIALLFLQYQLWYGQGGVQDVARLRRVIAVADIQNAHMIERNTVLMADVNDLCSGDEAVEERARNTMGMVRHGERFIQVITTT